MMLLTRRLGSRDSVSSPFELEGVWVEAAEKLIQLPFPFNW